MKRIATVILCACLTLKALAQNPAIQYTLRRGWGPEEKTIALNFLQPPPGSENDNYTTMIASGDLPDILRGKLLLALCPALNAFKERARTVPDRISRG